MSFRKKLVLIAIVVVAAGLFGGCSRGQTAAQAAVTQIGTQYRVGGAAPGGFDCSGLTSWAWRRSGTSLPHSAAGQYAATRRIPRSQLQPGDLVFYGSHGRVSHVAMYVGGGRIVQAQKVGTRVTYKSLDWWASMRIGFGRVPT